MPLWQTLLPGYTGVAVVVEPDSDGWSVYLYDRDIRSSYGPYGFADAAAARAWAAREYRLRADAWEQCEKPGSDQSLIGFVRNFYGRRLSAREAAAVADLAYSYSIFDARGRYIYPTEEACATSTNVVAHGLIDELDWDREGDAGFETGGDSWELTFRATGAMANAPEFRALWHALTEDTREPRMWEHADPPHSPKRLPIEESGALRDVVQAVLGANQTSVRDWVSGHILETLGLMDGVHALPADSSGLAVPVDAEPEHDDARSMNVVVADGRTQLIFAFSVADGPATYLWADLAGTLRGAAVRSAPKASVESVTTDAVANLFERERDAWRQWAMARTPSQGGVA